MKTLLHGIAFIILVGIGGLVYRNAIEYPAQPAACPMDARVCPDGTSVGRTGPSCSFPVCSPPNVSLPEIGLEFALPEGFEQSTSADSSAIATYQMSAGSSTEPNTITIRRYPINASSTALDTIKATAISDGSGLPISATSFTSTVLGTHRFTVVTIGRFEGVVDVAYYLARGTDVLRFDAIDRGVDWTNPSLDIAKLPTQIALRKLLATLQGE